MVPVRVQDLVANKQQGQQTYKTLYRFCMFLFPVFATTDFISQRTTVFVQLVELTTTINLLLASLEHFWHFNILMMIGDIKAKDSMIDKQTDLCSVKQLV